MSKIANFFFGLVAGALVGSALAVMFAPASGRQLRSDINGSIEQMRREVNDAALLRRKELENQLAALRGEILSE